ncbi:acyltransferase domain-containing protein [Streptomyces apocyni]|uniref:acyltransferase domain-containing protein n=1 Tax=Streptomyces apocyni TaxID=2654677 RepID=UPI0012EAECA5|nr:acyltransferase domain-containing protein [Streptomyces apocyni]
MSGNTSAQLNTAFLFPGQGGFDGDALRAAQANYPQVREIFERVDAETMNLFSRRITDALFGPGEAADLRELLDGDPWVSQVAIYGAGLAAYEVLAARGVRPDVLAGHSLGEITALVAAGAFSIEDGVRIVVQRVEVIQRQNGIDGRMVALSAGAGRARRLLDLLDDPLLAVATENHDEQTVVSGPSKVLDRVVAIAGELGIGTIEIDAPFPFHTPALASAAPEFAEYVRKLDQLPLLLPVYSPILQRYYEPDDALADLLAEHFVKPVRFATAVRHLQDEGVTTFVEVGGRAALSKLVTRLTKEAEVRSLATLAVGGDGQLALDATLETLRGADPTPNLAALLAPSVPVRVFEAYWNEHGAAVVRRIADDLAAFQPETAATGAEPRQEASPASAEGASAAPDRAAVFAELRTLYAGALEYPEEVFEDGVQLEAELGVDSVKQVELLSRVSKHYGLPPRTSGFRLADHSTLGRIADFVLAELAGQSSVTAG